MFSILWGTRKHRVLISFHNIEVNIMIRRSGLESRGFVRALALPFLTDTFYNMTIFCDFVLDVFNCYKEYNYSMHFKRQRHISFIVFVSKTAHVFDT